MGLGLGPPSGHQSAAPSSTSGVNSLCGKRASRRQYSTVGYWAQQEAGGGPLCVQLLVMPEDGLLVEWDPPLRREIGRNARALGDAVAHCDDSREFLFQALHRLWECVAKAFDDLEQRQVGI